MKTRTPQNAIAEKWPFLSRAVFGFGRSVYGIPPKKKNIRTAWRGLNTPAHVPAGFYKSERQRTP